MELLGLDPESEEFTEWAKLNTVDGTDDFDDEDVNLRYRRQA